MKLAALGAGTLAFRSSPPETIRRLPQFPAGDYLGRVAVAPDFYSTPLKSQPDENAPDLRPVGHDEVVVWAREVIGTNRLGRPHRRWVQTPEGFIYTPDLQPVRNLPNAPMAALPAGKDGFWAEVTVPYVDLQIQTGPIAPMVKYSIGNNLPIRLYYGQVVWIDQVGAGADGGIVYRVNEGAPLHGYGYGDIFLADGAAFRPLTNEDVSPIHPEVDPALKKIIVDATPGRQTLSCFEGNTEVYYCRVSTGYAGATGDFSTPTGDLSVRWKIFSIHMAANTGSDSGYDTMAVPWPVFFAPGGVAIHGTFWHNLFGMRKSHGCVNVTPEDAKWIFRWTTPAISLDQSEWREEDNSRVGGSFSTSVTVDDTSATA